LCTIFILPCHFPTASPLPLIPNPQDRTCSALSWNFLYLKIAIKYFLNYKITTAINLTMSKFLSPK
jgi:hypothetical protein